MAEIARALGTTETKARLAYYAAITRLTSEHVTSVIRDLVERPEVEGPDVLGRHLGYADWAEAVGGR